MDYLRTVTHSDIIDFLKEEAERCMAEENLTFQVTRNRKKRKEACKATREAIDRVEYEVRRELSKDSWLSVKQQESLWNYIRDQGYGTIAEIERRYAGILEALTEGH